MPCRRTPLVCGHLYHIFNRSVGKIPVFKSQSDYQRFLEVLNYYRFNKTPFSFSKLKKINQKQREEVFTNLLKDADFRVEIIAFCLMPNHFHFILRQVKEGGIVTFMANSQNSYAKYFNTKYKRVGAVFQNSFKTVLIEDDNQLIHLSRYLHLNPFSSWLIKNKEDLFTWPLSSFLQYLGQTEGFCQPQMVMSRFTKIESYKKFVFDQADYQKELAQIKHLFFE